MGCSLLVRNHLTWAVSARSGVLDWKVKGEFLKGLNRNMEMEEEEGEEE